MTRSRVRRIPVGPLLFLIVAAVVLGACVGSPSLPPGATPTPSPTPVPPLAPASPGANPIDLLAFIFTPLFQVMFIILVGVYSFLENLGVPAAIGWAIVALTLVVRAVVIPLYRRQLVSQRRMQMLQPEIKEIQRRYKGDAMKARLAQQELFKERGVSPLAGCLPLLLQMPLLFMMYSVIQSGLTNQDPRAMLTVFGVELVHIDCKNMVDGVINASKPCIDTIIPFLGNLDVSVPSYLFAIFGFGVSILAIVSAILQLIQSRMMLPIADPENDDPNTRIQRQTMLLLPLISIAYGGFLPAGLFIYWITATVFSIVQQYLIVGWGGMFPFMGWSPAFATGHTPRYPVAMPPPPEPGKRAAILTDADKKSTADKTIRHRERGRQGRRGRRR